MSGNTDRWITLAHGNGGRFMRELIDELFARHLANPYLDVQTDAACVPFAGDLIVTTDGFTVQPLEFPGGNIGHLAVNGTVNDLAVAGAHPRYLTVSAVIEEGLERDLLERIIKSLAQAAHEADVYVVAGDTKVVPRGHGGGLYLTTTGFGSRACQAPLGMRQIQPGDHVLISGSIGDHGTTVLLAREAFGLRGDLRSDCACVLPLTRALWDLPGVRFMRDPTRGGLATVAYEIGRATGFHIALQETAIPLKPPVQAVCAMLGYDPYYLACEGRVVAVVAADQADEVLRRWQALGDLGHQAAIIGDIGSSAFEGVVLVTELGGERVLDELEDDPLPRIC